MCITTNNITASSKENGGPKILIIPDVHGRTFWKDAVKKYPDLPTVFLGDYLDPYTYWEGIDIITAMGNFAEILNYKEAHAEKVTLLLGNHDIHYLSRQLDCSRKSWEHYEEIHELFMDDIDVFKILYRCTIGDKQYLLSHAGILPKWVKSYFPNVDTSDTDAVCKILESRLKDPESLIDFSEHELMSISRYRGGYKLSGSIVWADVEEHIKLKSCLPNVYQIFGHTQQEQDPIIAKDFACLDVRKAFVLTSKGKIVEA